MRPAKDRRAISRGSWPHTTSNPWVTLKDGSRVEIKIGQYWPAIRSKEDPDFMGDMKILAVGPAYVLVQAIDCESHFIARPISLSMWQFYFDDRRKKNNAQTK